MGGGVCSAWKCFNFMLSEVASGGSRRLVNEMLLHVEINLARI